MSLCESGLLSRLLVEQCLDKYPSLKNTITLKDRFLEKKELYELIQKSDALIHPYRSEGFGMPVLEAMALGTPVIQTANGATNEFCPPECSVLIRSRTKVEEIPMVGNYLLTDSLWYLEPEPNEIATTIKNVLTYKEELAYFTERAYHHSHEFTWENAARKAYDSICNLLDGRVMSTDPFAEISNLIKNIEQSDEIDSEKAIELAKQFQNIGDIHSANKLLGYLNPNSIPINSQIHRQVADLSITQRDLWSRSLHRYSIETLKFSSWKPNNGSLKWEASEKELQVAEHISKYLSDCRKFLEVGCINDSMIRVMSKKGIEVTGISENKNLAEHFKQENIDIVFSKIPEGLEGLELETYNAAYIGNLAETLPPAQLRNVLTWINSKLERGGMLLIKSCDFTDVYTALNGFWLETSNIRPYPIETLKQLLASAGFMPIEGGCRKLKELSTTEVVVLGKKTCVPNTQ